MKLSLVISLQPTSFEALAFKGKKGEWLDPILKKMKELGFEGVELALANPLEINQTRVLKIVNKYGLEVPAIGTGQAYLRDKLSFLNSDEAIRKRAVERIKRDVDFAKLFGGKVIIGLIRGKIGKRLDKAKATNYFVESMKACADYALEKNLNLVIEPINRYETDFINRAEEAIELINLIGVENVRLLLDTFHMNIEETSIEHTLETSKPYLSHVHVADSNRWAPGCGHLDFESIVRTLEKIGYRGYLSAEILPLPDQLQAAQKTTSFFMGISERL
ncbi:MAG TPA: sugar phosphate isomerase/epimerase [Thermoplasmata archaeon]|nr:sugar phosphate isomerase/epimerase [Thermoplasmata archaeon]